MDRSFGFVGLKTHGLVSLVTSYHIATGADDHQIKIWDLRHRKELYTLPAHSNLISSVKFEPVHGRFLVSSSFDQTVKVRLRALAALSDSVHCPSSSLFHTCVIFFVSPPFNTSLPLLRNTCDRYGHILNGPF